MPASFSSSMKRIMGGLAALVLAAGCGEDPAKSRPVSKTVRNEAPVSNSVSDMETLASFGYVLNLIPSETGKNYNGIEFKSAPEWQRQYIAYDEIICEVKRANFVSGNLKNVYQTKLLFSTATSLNGATVEFYGVSKGKKEPLYNVNMKTRD